MITKNPFEQNTIVYDDLMSESSKIHSWQSPDNFPIHTINNQIKDQLKEIVAIEHSFSGVLNHRALFDSLFETVNARLMQYFQKLPMVSFIFKSEHKAQVRNRVRSHKGLVNKSLLSKDLSIEKEITIKDNYTVFAAVMKLSSENFNDVAELFMDNDTSFIMSCNSADIMTESFLESVVGTMMSHKGTSSLNYLELISKLCNRGYLIHRMGGDGGDTEVTFQIFTRKENQNIVLSSLT